MLGVQGINPSINSSKQKHTVAEIYDDKLLFQLSYTLPSDSNLLMAANSIPSPFDDIHESNNSRAS
jgi:hypothetical protein